MLQGGKIEGSTATFGAPFFGDRVLGRLVYADHGNLTHCTEEDYSLDMCGGTEESAGEESHAKLINIFLVRRGGCSFVKKVQVASKKCAHAVIIVDKVSSPWNTRTIKNIIVNDDGYGANIHIPSVLISKNKGQPLIDATKAANADVVVELAW